MKLPMKSPVEGGDKTAEGELEENSECNLHIPGSSFQTSTDSSNRFTDSPSGLRYSLNKEAVYEWFGLYLSPAKRIEFMCGLLHMCQPLELRFLGSCLEDLARKDFHILRDSEIKANGPNDLSLLTDVSDPVIRSKLLVCMSLLGSENSECAGILFRILSHVDSFFNFNSYGLPVTSYTDPQHHHHHHRCGDGEEPVGSLHGCRPPMEAEAGAQQQLKLLFTMASLHPAFPFHQRESLRMHLDKIEGSFEEGRQHYHHNITRQCNVQPNDYFAPSTDNLFERTAPAWGNQTASRKAQREGMRFSQHHKLSGKEIRSAFSSFPTQQTQAIVTHLSEDKLSFPPGSKKKVKSATDGEKGKKGDSRISYITNGILRPAPVQLVRSESGKDPRLDAGSGPDTCGETSSESYSSPSSPRHDGRESFESEDENDKDTDSNSEDSGNVKGAASAEGRSVTQAVFLKDAVLRPESHLSTSKFTHLSFMPPIQCVIQHSAPKPEGMVPPQTVDGKPMGLMVTVPTALPSTREPMVSPAAAGDLEKQHLDTTSLPPALRPSQPQQPGSPAVHPLIQRFKITAPPICQSSENYITTQHQPAVGAINLISPNSAYMSTLKTAGRYPSGEPMGSGLPPAMPHTEAMQTHNKPPPLSLPTGLPAPLPSFGLPVSRSSPGAAGTPPPAHPQAVGQVQAMVPPAVPTHTPGPVPSPSPALTHSTAQSDSTCYIDSSGSSAGPHQPPQQQQPQPHPPPQQLGCGACGCRGSCGSNHPPSFFFTPQLHRQLFSVQPLFHLTSLCNSSYLNQAHQSNGATQLPFFPPAHSPYPNGPLLHAHTDHMLGNQANYGLQQMAAFGRFYPLMYQTVSMMPNAANGAAVKKNGNISCYNCGTSGHYAQDCKQPSIEASQQGNLNGGWVRSF
ncbi:Zinc finger CCHC domain-containing protein 2 [Acipenser ruthenus]|uniref:Zinc finger CCHC domain-containing protein 2 n=1 Tax=Acipenser ruthenus TaxID=7906 RepID=A0A444U3Z7_ACIRT|nr:Zinc finger CCHC domain-containing protein 2 [Acipenser ruthenus]